jgi:carbon storage regulator CsrA
MLVLTRKENERVVIGNEITISVVSIGPGRVKIGIEAPKWMAIDRQEIHDRKQLQTPEIEPAVVVNRLTDQFEAVEAPKKPR